MTGRGGDDKQVIRGVYAIYPDKRVLKNRIIRLLGNLS